jgi:hypothetical protein
LTADRGRLTVEAPDAGLPDERRRVLHFAAAVLRFAPLDAPDGALVPVPLELPSGDPAFCGTRFWSGRVAVNRVAPAGIQLAGSHAALWRGANAIALLPSMDRVVEGREHEGALVARELIMVAVEFELPVER